MPPKGCMCSLLFGGAGSASCALWRYSAYVLAILIAFPCFGSDVFYLTTGFTLEADSHTQEGGKFVLRTAAGTVELPVTAVERIESVPEPDPQASSTASKKEPEELIRNAALAQGLPPEFVRSVAVIESGLQVRARSPKGALGLLQLMPATAVDLRVKPDSPDENARGGAKYLRDLLLLYHYDATLALAAYNAGPGAVAKFGGVPPYPETRRYVERVLREFSRQHKLPASGLPADR